SAPAAAAGTPPARCSPGSARSRPLPPGALAGRTPPPRSTSLRGARLGGGVCRWGRLGCDTMASLPSTLPAPRARRRSSGGPDRDHAGEVLSLAEARRIALAAPGVTHPAPRGPVEPGADGLGERAPARSLPAAVQPARAVPDLAAGSGGVPPAPRAVRVLGARGLPDTGRAASVPALADGPGAPARLGADAPG